EEVRAAEGGDVLAGGRAALPLRAGGLARRRVGRGPRQRLPRRPFHDELPRGKERGAERVQQAQVRREGVAQESEEPDPVRFLIERMRNEHKAVRAGAGQNAAASEGFTSNARTDDRWTPTSLAKRSGPQEPFTRRPFVKLQLARLPPAGGSSSGLGCAFDECSDSEDDMADGINMGLFCHDRVARHPEQQTGDRLINLLLIHCPG
ncbi:hypothetical protein THAOC_05817, partial [Thalassiosira oceanica]